MRIVGFNYEKISVEKKKEAVDKLNINSNIKVNKIEKDTTPLSKDQDILRFNFNFTIDFEPGFANLDFRGNVLLLTEPSDTKEILKAWKKKKIEDKVRIPIFNFILTKCNLKALEFSEDLNLPPHIPLPRITPQQQGQQPSAQGNAAGYVQ